MVVTSIKISSSHPIVPRNCVCFTAFDLKLFVHLYSQLLRRQTRVKEEDSERVGPVLPEPRATRPLGEYCFTDNSGGLLFPVYLSGDYPVKPRELSQRPLTPSAMHCGIKRASRSRTSPCLCAHCVRCSDSQSCTRARAESS